MFFGLEVKSNQNQAKPITTSKTLKLSQAVLEPSKNSKKEPVSLMVEYNKKQFILCVLDPSQSWQCPLDLLFEPGAPIKFFLKGSGTVHLTGYENFDDLDDMSMSVSSDDEFSETEDDAPETKRLSKASIKNNKNSTNGLKNPSKVNGKTVAALGDDDDDDDSEDDIDFEVDGSSDDVDDDDDDDDDDEDGEDENMSDEDLEVGESSDEE